MNKYIDAEKLIAEIEALKTIFEKMSSIDGPRKEFFCGKREMAVQAICLITSLQQEQPIEGKQAIIITETNGDANIHWDCRSLDDVMALLKSAESFITEKQIENTSGPGSSPDYATTEGRYSHLFKRQQEQPEVDLEKEIMEESEQNWYNKAAKFWYEHCELNKTKDQRILILDAPTFTELVHDIYELGLNARKEK